MPHLNRRHRPLINRSHDMRFCLNCAAILLTIILLGCKPKQTAVTGQIFIVTRGAENVKLGAVEVLLVEKSQVVEFLQKKQSDIESKIASRRQELANAQHESANQQAVIATKVAPAKEDVEKAKADYKSFITNESLYTGAKAGEKFKVMESAESRLAGVWDTLESARAQLDDLQSRVVVATALFENASTPTIEDYLTGFSPIVVQKAISDADGKFFLIYPRSKSLTILASGQRTVSGKTEKYYWIVDAPTNIKTTQVLLNNNNLVFVDPDGYFKLKPRPIE